MAKIELYKSSLVESFKNKLDQAYIDKLFKGICL